MTTPDPNPRPAARPAAVAGMLAPAVFLGGLLVLDLIAGRVEVSDHELGPHGWLMHLVFLAFGVLVLTLAAGLFRSFRGRRSGHIAAVFVGIFGLGGLLGAITPDPDEPHTWHGLVHFGGFLLVTLALLPAMVSFAVAARRDPRWRGFAWGSAAAAVGTAVVVFAPATSSGSDYALWTGPASMLELVVLCAWIEAVALRLYRLAREDRSVQNARAAATAAST